MQTKKPEKKWNLKKKFKKIEKIFFKGRNLIVTLFEENIFPLPKRGKPKCEKWSKEKEILKEEEYIPSKKIKNHY